MRLRKKLYLSTQPSLITVHWRLTRKHRSTGSKHCLRGVVSVECLQEGRSLLGGLAAFFSSSPIMCTDHATHPHPPYPRDFVIRILPGSSSSPPPVVLVTFSDHNRAHHYYHGAASPVIPSSSVTSSLPRPVSRSLPTPYDQSTHLNRQPGSHLFTA